MAFAEIVQNPQFFHVVEWTALDSGFQFIHSDSEIKKFHFRSGRMGASISPFGDCGMSVLAVEPQHPFTVDVLWLP